jgi:hypothetical protein
MFGLRRLEPETIPGFLKGALNAERGSLEIDVRETDGE